MLLASRTKWETTFKVTPEEFNKFTQRKLEEIKLLQYAHCHFPAREMGTPVSTEHIYLVGNITVVSTRQSNGVWLSTVASPSIHNSHKHPDLSTGCGNRKHLHTQEPLTAALAAARLGTGTVSLALVWGNVPGDDGTKSRSYSGKSTAGFGRGPKGRRKHRAADSIRKRAKFQDAEVCFRQNHGWGFLPEAQKTRRDGLRKRMSIYPSACLPPPLEQHPVFQKERSLKAKPSSKSNSPRSLKHILQGVRIPQSAERRVNQRCPWLRTARCSEFSPGTWSLWWYFWPPLVLSCCYWNVSRPTSSITAHWRASPIHVDIQIPAGGSTKSPITVRVCHQFIPAENPGFYFELSRMKTGSDLSYNSRRQAKS